MRIPILLAALLLASAAHAQQQPLSALGAGALRSVDVLVLPAVDNAALAAYHDAAHQPGKMAYRFAEPFAFDLTTAARGTWEERPDGSRLWRLVVASPGAYSLNFGFSRFALPEGASLWIYAAGQAPEYRPFTHADNAESGELWTPIVPGDEAVIELNLPPAKAGTVPPFELTLGQVAHAFRPSFLTEAELVAQGRSAAEKRSGSCNVDVACPEGDPYRDIIRSVGAYTRSGTNICSGAAVNNTAQDRRPLFLTANHCGNTAGNAASVVVYWNYQNSTCRPPGSPQSGGAGDGSRAQFNSGTTLRGSGSASDWAVLEFVQPILPEAQVFLAGWDRRDQVTPRSIAIHHPRVMEKRISFDNDPTTITTYLSATPTPTGTHLRVGNWELGTTEGGSSGSPLFSPERRIVGQLHGGYASCTSITDDWYGRVFHSMNTGMAAILDPTNSGVQTLDGRENSVGLFASGAVSPAEGGVGATVRFTYTLTNPGAEALAGVQLVNALPAGLTFAGNVNASTGSASQTGNGITWTATVPAGGNAVLAFDATIAAGAPEGPLSNTAVVSHASLEQPIQVVTTVRVIVPPDRVYESVATVPIPDNQCPNWTNATLNVPDAFTVDRVKLGVVIQHTWRGDLRVSLTSPAGTTANLIDRVGTGANGTSADNLNALISDSGPAGVFGAAPTQSTAAPFYALEGRPERGQPGTATLGAMADFSGQQAQGTWTLRVCDGAGADTGSLLRWALQFFGAATSTEGEALAAAYVLEGPGPNPVRDATTLSLRVREAQHVRATLYDATGRLVRVLHDAPVADGLRLDVATEGLPAGLYMVRVAGDAFATTRTLTVVR